MQTINENAAYILFNMVEERSMLINPAKAMQARK